jgi:hypothetical protein
VNDGLQLKDAMMNKRKFISIAVGSTITTGAMTRLNRKLGRKVAQSVAPQAFQVFFNKNSQKPC